MSGLLHLRTAGLVILLAGGACGVPGDGSAGSDGNAAVRDPPAAEASAPSPEAPGPVSGADVSTETAAPSDPPVRPDRVESDRTRGDTLPGRPSWTREDRDVLAATVAWARSGGVHRLPMGERVARIGERFVGAPYVPQTLDPPGPERLVVNLRAFDCVTFVESVLSLAHVVARPEAAAFARAAADADVLEGATRSGTDGAPEAAGVRGEERAGELATDAAGPLMDAYSEVLTALRYRGGRLQGYPSRLHYFSEWIADNEARGLVEDVTAELGGEPYPEPPTFMTGHRDAYRQLADPATFQAVQAMEARLADRPRHRIPQERVKGLEDRIRTGDIIAATSALPGLDVAHTGIALRGDDGVLRLMHAPLVGETVQISRASLGERLLGLSAQDGVMVARPRPAGPVD